MSSNIEQHSVPVDSSKGIDIGKIEAQLKSLWQDEKSEDGKESHAVTRARVLNLLVYVDSEDEAKTLDDTLTETTTRHPARALVMIVDKNAAKQDLQAWVSSRCQLQGPSGKQICCEQVTFQVKGDLAKELPSAVNPLLAPDLPVFLWWSAVPSLKDPIFSRLAEMSDRIIIDSADFTNPRKDIATLGHVLKQHAGEVGVSDFNWARLTQWRTLFASFYDVPDYRSYLDRVNELVIEYAPRTTGSDDISTRALLLAGWLADSLGWKLDTESSASDGDNKLFAFTTGDRSIALRFTPVERSPDLLGRIARATLQVRGEGSACFSVERSPDGKRLVTSS